MGLGRPPPPSGEGYNAGAALSNRGGPVWRVVGGLTTRLRRCDGFVSGAGEDWNGFFVLEAGLRRRLAVVPSGSGRVCARPGSRRRAAVRCLALAGFSLSAAQIVAWFAVTMGFPSSRSATTSSAGSLVSTTSVLAMNSVTSSGTHGHSSLSCRKSNDATTPTPVCFGGSSMARQPGAISPPNADRISPV